MSTKTLRKRIALVAVSALGFGLVSTVPATAAYPATSSLTLGWTSVTVVDSDATDNNGYFYADANQMAAASSTTTTRTRLVANETIAVTVVAAPTGRSVTDLNINSVTNAATAINTAFAQPTNATDDDEDILVTGAANDTHGNSNNTVSSTTVTGNENNRYWFAVNTDTTNAIGAGEYTLRVRLTNAEAVVTDYTVKVKFVASIADAGAVLTLAKNGVITTGTSKAYAYTANTSVTATLRDANGGRVQIGQAITGNRTGWDPTLNADIVNSSGVSVETLTIADSGVTAVDHVACATGGAAACSTTGTASADQVLNAAINAAADGVYGVTDSDIDATASTTTSVRVRISNTSVSASIAIPVVAASTGSVENTTVTLTATGILASAGDTTAVGGTTGANTLAYTLPLSAKSASLVFDTDAVGGEYLTNTVTWSGNYSTTAVTPASATSTGVYVDSLGKFTVDLTNSSPVAGSVATIKVIGFDDSTHYLTVTLTWATPAITTLTVVDPIADVYVKAGSTTVINVKATDQFGNALAGEQLVPSFGSTSANYSATKKYDAVVTDANGVATFSVVDAKATADLADTVTFTSVTNSAKTVAASISYVATLPAVSAMYNYYSNTFAHTATSITTAVPAAGIGATSPVTLVLARNLSKDLSANTEVATNDMIAIRVRANTSTGVAAEGAALTLSASTGGWVLNSLGLPASSRTIAVDANGDAVFQVLATAEGVITFTATSGTASSTIKLFVADQDKTTGRTVAISGATTGAANGSGVPMTVTVKDRYGNGVTGVSMTVSASGVGALMGGATSQSFTTDATGTFTFLATSYVSAGGSATYTARANDAGDATSVAGYVSTTAVDATLAAGVASVSATVTFAEGVNAAEANAQAATDAAAEATDAANAATDAANAAAEAADAATAAAQDAADAVAALSTQVSEMVNALKKQITALTNLVIKIQKKVKA